MIFTFSNLKRFFVFVTPLLVLSGCASISDMAFNHNAAPEKNISVATPIETSDYQLQTVEPKMCLDEELVALSKTGIWNEKPSPVSKQPPDDVVYDFPLWHNKQVEMYLNLFQTKQRKQFTRWLARSTAYRSMMEKELSAASLPLDLVYLSMIESGFNQLAYSRSKAVGLWQFMKGTGKQYHLRIDRYVDERRNAEKSTKAAVSYLSDLYKEFGDWHLAVAAYNGGPGKIRNGLKRHKVDNFWDLASRRYLRIETKRYVPKLIAALLIAKKPEKYGFYNINYQTPLQYDTLTVGPGMNLNAIAMISNSNTKIIKQLNRELRQNRTPLNVASYEVKIPQSTAVMAQKNLARLHSIVSTGYKTHKIRKGDTLTKICSKYGVNKTTILKVNNLHSSKLSYGRNLRIPYSTITYQLLPEGSKGAMAAYRDSLILHRIKPGDTISKIARLYRVPPAMIVEWNGLKDAHSIRAGQQLALYIDKRSKADKKVAKAIKRTTSTPHLLVLRADKIKIFGKSNEPFQWYNVRSGDSLWTISRKFRATTADIKKWNNLKSNLIHPGSKLRLKKV